MGASTIRAFWQGKGLVCLDCCWSYIVAVGEGSDPEEIQSELVADHTNKSPKCKNPEFA